MGTKIPLDQGWGSGVTTKKEKTSPVATGREGRPPRGLCRGGRPEKQEKQGEEEPT